MREEEPDAARGGMDQNRVALLDWVSRMRKIMRRHALQHDGRGVKIIQSGRHRHQPRGRHHGEFRVAAADLCPRHPLTDARLCHARSHCNNFSGAFVAGNERQLTRVVPGSLVDVDEVEPGRAYAHERLARAGFRRRQRLEFKHLGSAKARHLEGAVVRGEHDEKVRG